MSATVRNYTNQELRGSLIFTKELQGFPEAPKPNEMVLIDGVLWIYSMIGGIRTWFPLNNQKNTYTHTQGQASADWNVQHGMGTEDFVLGVYDSDNNFMYPSGITQVGNNSFHLTFTEPVTGRAVAFFNTEAFAPTVTAQNVNADSISVGGGTVVADDNGLSVNGNPVQTLNSQGQADYGTL